MANRPNDCARTWGRSAMLGLAVLCVAVVAALFIARFTKLVVFAHYQARGGTIIENMKMRHPENVMPRAWDTAVGWTSTAYCNVCVVDAVSILEMKSLVSDLEVETQNDVDLSTCSRIWERLKAVVPQGKDYYARFWPEYRRDLAYAQASDESLPTLEGVSECQYLDLRGTSVTDVGLVYLKKAKKLESLALSVGTTDAGMRHLNGMTNLRWLSLIGTKVTDRGLEQLKELPRLETLYVAGSDVTEEGGSRFQRRFPNCKIER